MISATGRIGCGPRSPVQEAVAVAVRRSLLLEDMLSVVRACLNPNVSRSGVRALPVCPQGPNACRRAQELASRKTKAVQETAV